jgi:hypothetical protein
MLVEPQAADTLQENLDDRTAALSYAASTFQCTPTALSQGHTALGAQAGAEPLRQITEKAGCTGFRRMADSRVNAVYEATARRAIRRPAPFGSPL